MPPVVAIAVAIGAGLGATGLFTAFTIAGSFALAGAVAYGGLALVSYLLTPKPNLSGLGGLRGDTRRTIRQPFVHARWVLGRARIGGALVYYLEPGDDDRDVHLILVLCEGPIEGVEKIWADGEELAWAAGSQTSGVIPADTAVTFTKYDTNAEMYFYYDGGQPDELIAVDGSQWTTDHKLTNKAFVHIHLTQPDYGNNASERLFYRLPNFNFLVKGLKFEFPRSTGAEWSNNAAAIRYWWLTQRRAVPESAIDQASFNQAYSYCQTRVNNMLSVALREQGYPRTSRRYAINGIIHSDDNHENVEAEMDFSWAGNVVEVAGIHHFRPGADRTATVTIGPGDIIEMLSATPAPSLSERLNAATMTLAQSAEHEYTGYSVPEFEDTDAINRDGRKLPRDMGGRPYVNCPVTAGRLIAINLRRARANTQYQYRIYPGDDFALLSLIPTDRIKLTDPNVGLDEELVVITSRTVHPDWSVTISMESAPDGIYDDTSVLPPLIPTNYNALDTLRSPRAPANFTATYVVSLTEEYTVRGIVRAAWDSSPHRTRVVVKYTGSLMGAKFEAERIVSGDFLDISVPYEGEYSVTGWHVNRQDILSPSVTRNIDVSWSGLSLQSLADRVEAAIEASPASPELDKAIKRATDAATAAATDAATAAAAKLAAETAKTASETAKTAAETAKAAVDTALAATKTARDDASGFADDAEEEALMAADSASAAAGDAMAAAGSATTAKNEATASEGSSTSAARFATAAASSATAADTSASSASTSAQTATSQASAAGASAAAAKLDRTKAETAQSAAETAKTDAVSAKNDAESAESTATSQASAAATSATNASNSAKAASTSASTASTKATEASQSASAASTAETAAETAQSKAETAESNAATSATDAEGSATAAATSLRSIGTSVGDAAASATAAANSAKTAESAKDAAGTSASAASSAQTAAETAQGKAETAETNAANSATAADGSATAAASSASGISASVKAAADSATAAKGSATGAEGSKDAAATSETNAADSATAAAASAQTASASATTAGEQATVATTQATSAQTAAATAGTAANTATESATAADGSATAAASSAMAAAASAMNVGDAEVSAMAAATSAMTAAASATAAGMSASAAMVSETNAAASALTAQTSETAASASVTTATAEAAKATLEREAAAGFAGEAQQAVAGITQTVVAEIDKNLNTTFASVIALRAVAGSAVSALELVALSDPSGSRAAGIVTGDFQSASFQAGMSGWRLKRDGTAEFDAASIRGVLSAEHIDSDVRNWESIWSGNASGASSSATTTISGVTWDDLKDHHMLALGLASNASGGFIGVALLPTSYIRTTWDSRAAASFSFGTRSAVEPYFRRSGQAIQMRSRAGRGGWLRAIWAVSGAGSNFAPGNTNPPATEPTIVAVTTADVGEGGTYTLNVALSANPAEAVTVTATESDPDITVTPASRTFSTTNGTNNQTFTISGVQDADSANESATLTLTASGGSSDTHTVTFTIEDDEGTPSTGPAIVAVTSASVNEGGTYTLNVRLSANPTSAVTVRATESDADISVTPASRVFSTSNGTTNQTFTISGLHDADTTNDSATLTLTASGGSTDTHTVTFTISDDDAGGTPPTPFIIGFRSDHPTQSIRNRVRATLGNNVASNRTFNAHWQLSVNSDFSNPSNIYDNALGFSSDTLFSWSKAVNFNISSDTHYLRGRMTTGNNGTGTASKWKTGSIT